MFINKLNDSARLEDSVITFGNFDGLHLGHQKIISKVIQISKVNKLPSVLLSFNPHTNCIVQNKNFKVLIPFEQKIKILRKLNVDYFCEIGFNYKFSKLSADDFLDLLIDKYHPSYIVFGYDNYFGCNKSGSYEYVVNNSTYKNIKCIKVNEYQQLPNLIKTSNIKKLLLTDKIDKANEYLYSKYKLYGLVEEGYKIGRSLNFPTANINVCKEQIIPSNGVYSVNLLVGAKKYKSICNIGVCPTLHDRREKSIEVHIINKSLDLYNCKVEVEFLKYIRKEKKFNNQHELKEQIKNDIESVKEERIIKSE